MANSAQQIMYAKQSDWDTWKSQFIRRAKDSQLWTYIDPESTTPWPTAPVEPAFQGSQALRAARTTSAIRASPRRTTRSATTTINAGPHEEDAEDEGNEGSTYHDALSLFREQKIDFRRHLSDKKDLTTWVYSTVTSLILDQYCDAEESLREWYAALCEANKAYESTRMLSLMTEYQSHLHSIKKSARSLPAWIEGWKGQMARGIRYKVPTCTEPAIWSTDLINATKSLAITAPWSQYLILTKPEDVLAGRTTYLELAAHLEMFVEQETSVGPSRQVKAGAFPTFNDRDPVDAESDDKDDGKKRTAPDEPPRRGGIRGSRGSRLRGRVGRGNKVPRTDSGSARVKCKACMQGHSLEDCFYAFPEQAPSTWYPNETVMQLVEYRIKTEQLASEIERIVRDKRTDQS